MRDPYDVWRSLADKYQESWRKKIGIFGLTIFVVATPLIILSELDILDLGKVKETPPEIKFLVYWAWFACGIGTFLQLLSMARGEIVNWPGILAILCALFAAILLSASGNNEEVEATSRGLTIGLLLLIPAPLIATMDIFLRLCLDFLSKY